MEKTLKFEVRILSSANETLATAAIEQAEERIFTGLYAMERMINSKGVARVHINEKRL